MKDNIKNILRTIGPGILFAGAAIGGSHLIQSTRAGANYGFELVWLIFLINLMKYPFFEFGHRFTASTGKSLIEGYKSLGAWALWTFFIMSVVLSFITVGAIFMVSTGLLDYFFILFFDLNFETVNISIGLTALVIILLVTGGYSLLDKFVKYLVVTLSITTIIAFILAWSRGMHVSPDFVPPSYLSEAGLLFLIALMGWMPGPIELSVWTSLWQIERRKQTGYKPTLKDALTDFHIGYIGTAIMAFFFVGLGAFVLYGTGEELSNSGQIFSQQLVSLYSKSIGAWVTPIISVIAFITMFSTALTVLDAYPRTIAVSLKSIFSKLKLKEHALHLVWIIIVATMSVLLITLFQDKMKTMLDFATTISFIAAPVFAIINFKLITSNQVAKEHKPKLWLTILSYAGIIFLVGFSLTFIYFRF